MKAYVIERAGGPEPAGRIFDFGDVPLAYGNMESNRALGKLVVQL